MAAPAAPPYLVKAVYEYSSPHDDDLSFPNGQLITVTDEEDADWYYGEYTDASGAKQEGLFPRNFVKIYEPETPPRPSRPNRQKKEPEHSPLVNPGVSFDSTPHDSAPPPGSAPKSITLDDTKSISKPTTQSPGESYTTKPPEIEVPSKIKTSAVPPANDKPASGSFRDRINAFNKPAAPPVAPKPGGPASSGGTGFIKKPFVAPPPSKNAYVPPPREAPPQKIYRRDEEQIAGLPDEVEPVERPAPLQTSAANETEQVQPKPTSLKDRIALLQKQQIEQAARHAEGVQKKEKPKRPVKKRMGSRDRLPDRGDDDDDEKLDRVTSVATTGSHAVEEPGDEVAPGTSSSTYSAKAEESMPVDSPHTAVPRGFQSDANDADQSGAGDTEEGEETSTGKDDSDTKPRRVSFTELGKAHQTPSKETDVGDEEDDADEEEDEEEEEVDPEVKRRMEIRERMAKMSGGMGMAGMFGPPGGVPGMAPKKQNSVSNERRTGSGDSSVQTSRAPPVPIMPMPGMQKVQSPEEDAPTTEVDREQSEPPKSITQGREPEEMPDEEDLEEVPVVPHRRSLERPAPPPVPQERPVPMPPSQVRAVPPPLPTERPVSSIPSESRPIPPNPPSQPISPSAGSESDDEMPSIDRSSSVKPNELGDLKLSSHDRSQTSISSRQVPSLPDRSRQAPSIAFGYTTQPTNTTPSETSPISPKSPVMSSQRSSRVPPIPGASPAIPPSTPQNRAPPPPPPVTAPSRSSTGDHRTMPAIPQARLADDSEEEITEYEGDYDTDMAPDATHKDALKAHARPVSREGDSNNEEESLHHSGLPSLGPAPRAVPPPPPPNQPPRASRQSADQPRAPPPPPPQKEHSTPSLDDEYDPYNYAAPQRVQSVGLGGVTENTGPTTPKLEDPDDLYSASPPRSSRHPQQPQNDLQYTSPPQPPPSRGPPRQSLDVQRTSSNLRRSTDAPRASSEHGFIASDVDLGQSSQWWRQSNTPPPSFQNRRDIIYEVEESSTTRRGARQSITKIVYVLYMDYSQTVVTALFDAQNPAEVALEQHHQQPPARMRQDQLEEAHSRFGARMAEEASSKVNTVVGDGTSQGLVLDLLSSHPEALPPVGVRAYGALVYANLANATVQQFDEIRPGDIVTFRNTKFQGHRGPMHSKYNIEVGKSDHVGVVVDWDGTKKKVRAWEQGRESKKVKIESFKLGDMRSGEAKVWRVMPRKWVGWEGQILV